MRCPQRSGYNRVPAESMFKSENVATPLMAATTLVPLRVPVAGFVPMARIIVSLASVTVLPPASCISTLTWDIVPPVMVSLG